MESLILFLPFLLIMGGFMYFASRRQRRAMQATIELHESLRPGDRVHTTSGLQATVVGHDPVADRARRRGRPGRRRRFRRRGIRRGMAVRNPC
ncbi:hypothetical protein MAHJHV51_56400 [Mycobacterium avium subsp. hominissuis]